MPKQLTYRYRFAEGWLRGEDWWGDPVSGNFKMLDMLAGPAVKSMTEIQPPLDVAVGDMYVVPTGGAAEFAGHDTQLAMFTDDGWLFVVPKRGLRVRCDNPDDWFWFKGDTWVGEDWLPGDMPLLGTRYDVVISVGFPALPGDTLAAIYIPEVMTLPKDTPQSGGRCTNWPTSEVIMNINRNNALVGTITFTPGALTAAISVADNQIFAAGDLLTVVMPNAVPEDFMNYGITLRMLLDV